MTERSPTHDDFAEWRRDTKSDVKTMGARLDDVRQELRQENQALRAENATLRDRVTALETREQAFLSWHRPAFDELRQDVTRLRLWAVGIAAATGSAAAGVIELVTK